MLLYSSICQSEPKVFSVPNVMKSLTLVFFWCLAMSDIRSRKPLLCASVTTSFCPLHPALKMSPTVSLRNLLLTKVRSFLTSEAQRLSDGAAQVKKFADLVMNDYAQRGNCVYRITWNKPTNSSTQQIWSELKEDIDAISQLQQKNDQEGKWTSLFDTVPNTKHNRTLRRIWTTLANLITQNGQSQGLEWKCTTRAALRAPCVRNHSSKESCVSCSPCPPAQIVNRRASARPQLASPLTLPLSLTHSRRSHSLSLFLSLYIVSWVSDVSEQREFVSGVRE